MHKKYQIAAVAFFSFLSYLVLAAEPTTYRLYDAATFFFHNPDGIDFELKIDARDINHRGCGPGEMLVKVYPPDARPQVREVMPDDGVESKTYGPPVAAWDHEAWYYSSIYARGLQPAVRWSALSDPARLGRIRPQELRYQIKGGQKGLYRVVLVSTPDLFVTVSTEPKLAYGIAGGPDWLHGRADMYKKMYVYVPKGAMSLNLRILEYDRPYGRSATVKDKDGNVLLRVDHSDGFSRSAVKAEPAGRFDDQILTIEVSDSPGDYLLDFNFGWPRGARYGRVGGRVAAILCKDEATVRALQGGAIYHDGDVFWNMYQVRMHDWLKSLKPADSAYPEDLPANPQNFVRLGSNESTQPTSADRLMHDYIFNKNPQLLNAALRDMHEGMRRIGFMDHVNRPANLAYEMGTYSFFYHRPAWHILQLSDAPEAVKEAVREFAVQIGDRLAFARGMAMVNGNSLASLTQGLRYCAEATGDELQTRLFEDYWQRFSSGGFHDRIGIGPSGGVQESFGYDHHYGSYVLRGWRAVIADLGDARFKKAMHNLYTLYSYTIGQESNFGPWSSRTHQTPSGVSMDQPVRWKGYPGPDFTESVMNANEWFAARRSNYYAVTYHGRLTPSWMGDGFHGQIGYGGGMLCQLQIPGHGPVFAGKVNGSYGAGMNVSQWRNFRIHSLVGTTGDGLPLVAADSEHPNARLEGNTVTSSGDIRKTSLQVQRSYTFNAADIECKVSLQRSYGDKIYAIWGGLSKLPGLLTEAYEMLPYLERNTTLTALGTDGKDIGVLKKEQSIEAAGIVIDRKGYGAVLSFDRPRPVMLGQNYTVMIQLIDEPAAAEDIKFEYKILPYIGSAAAAGEAITLEPETVKRLQELKLEDIAGALAEAAPRQIKSKDGRVLAEIRLAVAGDQALAVSAQVNDQDIRRPDVVWRGSCLEVFGAMPESKDLGQTFLAPAAGEIPAAGFISQKSGINPAPGIQVQSQNTDGGYAIQALIPFSLLTLEPGAATVRLEFQVSTRQPVKTRGKTTVSQIHATLFGSARAYEDNFRYAVFEVVK